MSRAKKVLANIGKYSVFCLLMGLGGVIVTTIDLSAPFWRLAYIR